jgi:hypothetical protein
MFKLSHLERLVPLSSVDSASLIVQNLHRSMIDKKLACLQVVTNVVACERAKLQIGVYVVLVILEVRSPVLSGLSMLSEVNNYRNLKASKSGRTDYRQLQNHITESKKFGDIVTVEDWHAMTS